MPGSFASLVGRDARFASVDAAAAPLVIFLSRSGGSIA